MTEKYNSLKINDINKNAGNNKVDAFNAASGNLGNGKMRFRLTAALFPAFVATGRGRGNRKFETLKI